MVSVGYLSQYTSIALDSGDKPHISYADITLWDEMGDLKYVHWTGSGWWIETVDSAGDIRDNSIALKWSPHISYYDATNDDLKYARWTGSTWSIETVDSAGLVGRHNSIALDSGDKPHISYAQALWDIWVPELKYARKRATVGAGPDQTVDEGDTAYFKGSFADPSWLDTHTAIWDWGDGSPSEPGAVTEENVEPDSTGTVTGSHVYRQVGVYTVSLSVMDDNGEIGVDTLTVTVARAKKAQNNLLLFSGISVAFLLLLLYILRWRKKNI